MTECRKVQELKKEFIEKLSKIKAFKERIITLKSNNNFEYKRIRMKNINNNMLNDESKINALKLFSCSGDIKVKNQILRPKKIPPISTSVFAQNENSKDKDNKSNIKLSQKKLKPLHKPKTSEKSRDKKYKIKQNNEEKKNDSKSNNTQPYKSKEEPIKKIKIVSKIDNELYERLLNKPKLIKRVARSESPEIRLPTLDNNTASNIDKRHSSENLDNSQQKKKKIKKKKLPQLSSLVKETKFQYCVYPGNYGKLIDILMEKRSDKWVKTDIELVKYCDFIWSPLPYSIDFNYSSEKKQYVNHLEFCNNISNKLNLYYNLIRHCESKKINIFDYFPFTICLTLSQSNFMTQIENFKKFCTELPSFTPKSEVKYVERFSILGSRRTGESQTINIPQTYNSGKNMWIIKPINLNRGRCIQVLNDTNTIVEYLFKIQEMKKIEGENANFKCDHIILQKYLEKPLLYQGRKFDIRIWILIIGGQENFVYIFKQGHLKATCAEFDINSSSPFIHLTNYSVQKHNVDFSKKEIGNEISYQDFQDELDKKNTGKNFLKDIYPKIVYIIRLAVGSGKSNINHLKRNNCFEIFGCDFILDEKYKPYLLEINMNPGLEISSPLISKLVPRMVDDALKLTIDQKYYKEREETSFYPVDGYDDNENMWEKFSVI